MSHNQLKNVRFIGFAALTFIVFIVAIYLVINHALYRSMEQQAVTVAEIVAIQATSARTVYAREIAKKLSEDGFGPNVHSYNMKGYVPIPAQFLKKIGLESSKNTSELFYYRPVSKWNLEPTQSLSNDFLRWAWPQLEQQDNANPEAAIDWKPVWRVETNEEDKRFLRYLKADPASSESCVSCHNEYEKTDNIIQLRQLSEVTEGKQWKLHQLLGALYVSIPLDKVEAIANDQNRQTIMVIIFLSLLAILLSSLFIRRLLRNNHSLNTLAHKDSHDDVTGLINRRGFERYFDSIYEECDQGSDSENTLCLLKMNAIKDICRNHGKVRAGELLASIAKNLKLNVRQDDFIAYLGGDKFAVIMKACSIEKAKSIASHIIDGVASSCIKNNETTIRTTVSIGLGIICSKQNTIDDSIDAINSACEHAAEVGDNQVVVVDPDDLSLSGSDRH